MSEPKLQLQIHNSLDDIPPARAVRGLKHNQTAQQFIADFPHGSKLSASDFDAWAQKNSLLTVPVAGTAKNSDTWKAHIQRRHELRYRLNLAGTHPRMDSKAFSLDKITEGAASRSNSGEAMYEVRTPPLALRTSDFHNKIRKFTDNKFRGQFRYLMQSTDWVSLSDYERDATFDLHEDLRQFNDTIILMVTGIANKMGKLCVKLAARESLKSNPAVLAILEVGDAAEEP